MNIADCSQIVERTLSRIRAGFEVSSEADSCRVVTPFTRRDGDPFEVIVRTSAEGQFVVTDEGETLDFLELSGINVKRNQSFSRLLDEVRVAHDVGVERGTVVIRARSADEVGDAVLRLISAMNDLSQFELARRERQPQTFPELVEGELVGLGLQYETGVTRRGLSRDRHFAFGIDSDRNTVVEPLTATSSTRAVEAASVLIVSVLDVWRVDRSVGAVAVLDDRRPFWADRALPDLRSNGLSVIQWSRRHAEMSAVLSEPGRGTSDQFVR